MKRTVCANAVDRWIRGAGRDGIRKLAEATKIPTSTLSKIRQGRDIVDPLKRESLSRVLGIKESELFPLAEGKSRAS